LKITRFLGKDLHLKVKRRRLQLNVNDETVDD